MTIQTDAINKEEAWNEIEEAHCSLTSLSISEIEECLEAITNRLEKAMKLLRKIKCK